jgi:type I restriction enzyme S subunit
MVFKSTPWPLKMVSSQGQVQAGRQRSPHFVEGKMRCYLRVANVFDGFIDTSDIKQMPFSDKEYEIYKLAQGDILLNEGQSLELVGRPAIYAGKPASCCFQNTLVRFRPGPECDPKYALQLFQLCLQIGVFASIASQTTSIAHLGVKRFARLKLPFPPKKEQQAIATILSTWDRAIEKAEAIIEAKERRKAGLMQRLLTGKVRFGGFVKSQARRKTKSYDLPKDWGYLTIGDIAVAVSKKNGTKTSLPVLSCTKHSGLVDSLAYFGKQVFSKDLSTYKVVPRGAFAYATNHIEEGSIGYQDLHDKALISPMYTVFKTSGAVHDGFLFKLLKTEWYRHIFQTQTSASVDRRGSLRWKEFAKIHIPLPSMEEQGKIAEVLDKAELEIKEHRNQLSALKAQKKGLMQQLLTGKVRVKGVKYE